MILRELSLNSLNKIIDLLELIQSYPFKDEIHVSNTYGKLF